MDSPATTRAVEVRGLVKRYGDVVAVDGVDLDVPAGACFGLLGPNGAGKTTLVSILVTLLRPDAGRVCVLGHDALAEPEAVRRELGIVFQESTLDRELTGREHLDLHARLYHLDARRQRVEQALVDLGLTDAADRSVRGYSGGMKRRLEIARGLLHRPRLLFLDEPTLGLDVAARSAVWQRLRALNSTGETTLLLTTHSMEEADALCGRLAILDRGRVVAEGTPESLKAALGGDVVRLALRDGAAATEALGRVAGVSAVTAEVAPAEAADGLLRLRITTRDGPRRLPELLDAARPFGVEEVTLERPTLEHVFLQHTGHAFEPEEGAR